MSKRKIIRTLLSGMAAFLTLTLSAQSEENNLAENGSFENGTEKWEGKGVIDSVEFSDGKNSMCLDGTGTPVYLNEVQDITKKLKPSTEYILSADIKRTVAGKGASYVAVFEKAKKEDKDWKLSPACGFHGQIGKWEHFEVKFTTGPEIGHAIIILINSNSGGTVWYDNISLVEVK
jgi:hypothetical protein